MFNKFFFLRSLVLFVGTIFINLETLWGWDITLVDSSGVVGVHEDTSIAVDSANNVYISYYDARIMTSSMLQMKEGIGMYMQ